MSGKRWGDVTACRRDTRARWSGKGGLFTWNPGSDLGPSEQKTAGDRKPST